MSDDTSKNIEQVIGETAPDVLKSIPPEIQPRAVELVKAVVSAVHVTSYSGPLPPAEELRHYDTILPGAANRILTMAENQSGHRIRMETLVITSQQKQGWYGQWFAFAIAILFLVGSIIVTLQGYPYVGGVLGGSTIIGLVTVFILGKETQKRDLKSKE